jgi:hypothetical protein
MQEGLDKDLLALFRDGHRDLSDEPFVRSTAKLIESRRLRKVLARRLLQGVGIVCVALVSPLLIEGSLLLSNGLDYLFTLSGRLLGTPLGTFIAALCSIPFIVLNRKRIF